jgi:hypothetical protein
LNGHALSIKRGRYVLFLREICPPKKLTPKSCPVNGTVTGILLMDYYKKTLNYMPVLFYLGDKSDEGYINMGISSISEHNMMKI